MGDEDDDDDVGDEDDDDVGDEDDDDSWSWVEVKFHLDFSVVVRNHYFDHCQSISLS